MGISNYQNLEVWKKAMGLAKEIYLLILNSVQQVERNLVLTLLDTEPTKQMLTKVDKMATALLNRKNLQSSDQKLQTSN
ncbi:MAG: hypothetical protein FWG02_00790 [Holophagaceae bacterium]|nr:hypothetical protein [Holophagaceae bacterium]